MTTRETEEKLRKLAAIDTGSADRNWRFYLSGEGAERQEADDLIDILLFQRLAKDYRKGIFLDPPPASVCAGPYALGTVSYPGNRPYCPFGLREHEWIQHMLITGMTGTGKTNCMFHILREFKRYDKPKPFLVFDWKRNYRDLRQLPEFKQLQVFTVGSSAAPLRFNPLLPPPGTEPGHWLMKLVDVLKHAYFVGEGVEYLLRDGIDYVYEQCGMHDGSKTTTPTFFMAADFVQRRRVQGRMALWKASAVRVLASLCFRHGLGPVVNTETTWDYEKLLNTGVVLELDALSDSDKIFFTEAMILWLYELRKREGKRETFKHALVIEEGHHILSHLKEKVAGAETIMETSLRQIREFGETLIVIDQEPAKLSDSIKANTYTKITFNLGNGKDMLEMSSCMGLSKEEYEYLNLLEVGHAVVSLKGRVFVPLHVAFPKIAVHKGIIKDSDLSNPDYS
jgi:hypothetical protein